MGAYPVIAFCIAGCSFAPDVPTSAAPPEAVSWPTLLPSEALREVTSGLEARPAALDEETQKLAAQAADLRARAARLGPPVLTPAERQRLAEAAAGR